MAEHHHIPTSANAGTYNQYLWEEELRLARTLVEEGWKGTVEELAAVVES